MIMRFVASLAANTLTKIGQIPSNSKGAIIDIQVLNTTASANTVQIAYSVNGTTPDASEYVENGASADATGGIIIRSEDKLVPGEFIYVKTTGASIVRVTYELKI